MKKYNKLDFNNTNLAIYLKEIGRYPLLTKEEEIKLAYQWQIKKRRYSLKKLIRSNLRLVVNISKRYSISHDQIMDLVQEGNIGLIIAATKFEYDYGTRFSTYSTWWIRHYILRCLIKNSKIMKLPVRKERLINEYHKIVTHLTQHLQKEVTIPEAARMLGVPLQQVEKLLQNSTAPVSLSQPLILKGNKTVVNLENLLVDRKYPDPAAQSIHKQMKEDLNRSINRLPAREAKIILFRYGFHDGNNYTLKRTGKYFGLSSESIRQIEKRAISRIKHTHPALREYLIS